MTIFEKMLLNPRDHFKSPLEVLDDKSLTKSQKRRVLEQWQYDAKLLHDADQENMPSEQRTYLSQAVKCLHQLSEEEQS